MAYVSGYIVADGCITVSKGRIKNPFALNIPSAEKDHPEKIAKSLEVRVDELIKKYEQVQCKIIFILFYFYIWVVNNTILICTSGYGL